MENLENLTFEDEFDRPSYYSGCCGAFVKPWKSLCWNCENLEAGWSSYFFSVPLVNKQNPSERWAGGLDENGKIVYYHTPPEYHGNPINSSGSFGDHALGGLRYYQAHFWRVRTVYRYYLYRCLEYGSGRVYRNINYQEVSIKAIKQNMVPEQLHLNYLNQVVLRLL